MRRSTGRFDDAGSGLVGYAVVVAGTSWGGLAALRMLLASLPADFGIPMVVVQHRHRDSDTLLARFLQQDARLRVCDAEDKQPLEAGHVFIAPADYHLLVECGYLALSTEAPVRYSRPSIDAAMISAANAYGHRAVGVVLTGANADGSAGLRSIAEAGGITVVQDPAEAEAPVMPRSALTAVPRARVFPLARIGAFLAALPVTPATSHP